MIPCAIVSPRPLPESPADRARVEEQGLRRRLVEGDHRDDVVKEIQSFFDPAIAATMTINPDLSANPQLQVVEQLCTAYDTAPTVSIEADADLSPILRPQLWPLMQDVHRLAEAAGECYQRVDYIEGEIVYRDVPADMIWTARATGKHTHQPTGVVELVPRERGGEAVWTRETWDVSDPRSPVFRVEEWSTSGSDKKGRWVDATAHWRPVTETSGSYPYADGDGPIFPYIVNHRRVTNALWNWRRGTELARGTLRACALMSHWCDGFVDAAHPQRYGIDVEIKGARTRNVGGTRMSVVPTDRKSILLFTAANPGGSLGQFQAAMDPASAFASLGAYLQQMATFAGLSPADLQVTSGASGHAIYVSRDGQRRVRLAQQPSLREADQRRLATAARLSNAYGGTALPTEPEAYSIGYAPIGKSLEEKRAELEEIKVRKENGLASDVDAIRVFEPQLSEQQAFDRLVQIAREQAMVDEARRIVATPAPPAEDAPPPAADPAPDPDPDPESSPEE